MSTPNNGGADLVIDVIIIDVIVEPSTPEVEDTDLWGQPVDTGLFSEISAEQPDEDTMAQYERWTDDVELWVQYPGIPMPGPNGGWVGLLTHVIPSGNPKYVLFPRALGEKLRPWIPASLYSKVVAK